LEQVSDFVTVLGSMTHIRGAVDRVVVAAPDALSFDVAGFDEVGNDALRRPFGDTHCVGHVAHSCVRVACEAEQHLCVAGNERPVLAIIA
jgi:hypothetical protein